jgi:hypothetical protein
MKGVGVHLEFLWARSLGHSRIFGAVVIFFFEGSGAGVI